MFTISKTFSFSASHQLTHLADTQPDHKCARLHGHNYQVELILSAPALDPDGFVVDYGELSDFKHYLDIQLDHRHLNDVLVYSQRTTAENLAKHLYETCQTFDWGRYVMAVRVSETSKTWAEYRVERA